MRAFQIILIVVFGLLGVLGVLVFSGIIDIGGGGGEAKKADLLMWGTLPEEGIRSALRDAEKMYKDAHIEYVQKEREGFELELLRAVTQGASPDLVLFPHELLFSIEKDLVILPPETFPEREFRNTFQEGAEILVRGDGIAGLPLVFDPLVLFWNRDIFTKERITRVPDTWSGLISFASAVSERDDRGKIIQSAVALGESNNVSHFKDIFSALLLQSGDGVFVQTPEGKFVVTFGDVQASSGGPSAAVSSLAFYSGFANPVKRHYSWNKSLPVSFDAFTQGELALYFGRASEFKKIKERNPNLNFDVAPVPRLENGKEVSFGGVYALGVPNGSSKKNDAIRALYALSFSGDDIPKLFSEALYLPPARRDLLSEGSTDSIQSVFYDGAIISRAWLDPDPLETERLFGRMIEDVSTRVRTEEEAVQSARSRLTELSRISHE